jgi:glyoxylase I family protein
MTQAQGTNEALGGGGFHHVAVRVHDFDAAMRFYTEVLGFREKITWGEGDGRAVMLDTGDGNYLEVFAGGPAEPKPDGPILHIALRTTNVDGVIERVRAAGGKVTVEPKDVVIQSRPQPTPVRLAFFRGPAGEEFELFQNTTT